MIGGGIEMPYKYHIYADKRQKRKIRALAFPIKKNENIYLLKYVGLYPGGLITGGLITGMKNLYQIWWAYNRGGL